MMAQGISHTLGVDVSQSRYLGGWARMLLLHPAQHIVGGYLTLRDASPSTSSGRKHFL